ncbi:hypothetical protein R3P38DRAFT_2768331 [Favolaschia claudopus]|uniref:F-box domain-containing protein n=1 Tax=Favolaschia claudopus TaxID=2862362 RepID=A0AAW0CX78_9AGAR
MSTTTTSLPSPSLPLPIELVHRIAERYCSKEMLQNLSLASRMMANICRPLLFQNLDLHESPEHPTMDEAVTLFTNPAYHTAVILASTIRLVWFIIPEAMEEQILLAKILCATTHRLRRLGLTGQNINWDFQVGSCLNAAMLAVIPKANLDLLGLYYVRNLPPSMLRAMMGGTQYISLKSVGLAVDDIEDDQAALNSESQKTVPIIFYPRNEAVLMTWRKQPGVLSRFRSVHRFTWEASHLHPDAAAWVLSWAAQTVREIIFILPTMRAGAMFSLFFPSSATHSKPFVIADILSPGFPTILPFVGTFKLSILVLPVDRDAAWSRVFNQTFEGVWSQMKHYRFPSLEKVEFQLCFRNGDGGFPLPEPGSAEGTLITRWLKWLDRGLSQIISLKSVRLILTLEGWDLEDNWITAHTTAYFLARFPKLHSRKILLLDINSGAWYQEFHAPFNE